MCGIVGVVGLEACSETILDSLKRLEYRGYDSSGIVTQSGGVFQMNRAVGKLRNLSEVMREAPLDGQSGLGHTRWATHGGVSERNAHPHMAGEKVVIVHNGIIENHVALRAELEAKGHRFSSETDSEVLAHLFLEAFDNGLSPQQAGKEVIARI
ncbi:MAG: class II glutamine amidotransferase, partial [Pseudomonadota bacterium]|nr:class II glutamine amidotransferase [Pseudomonadota bacterium]